MVESIDLMRIQFPHSNLRNIRVYYLLSILTSGWFVLPNWMFLFALYTTRAQIGFIDASAILLGMFLEVPTGLISDVFGKKNTLLMGNLGIAIGSLIIAFSTTFMGFLIGNCIIFIGFAFNSGSFEAFGYDSLVEKGLEKEYDKVVSKSTFLAICTSFITVFAGGLLFAVDPRLPFIGWSIMSFLCLPVLLFSSEPKVDTEQISIPSALNKLKDGVSTIFSLKFRDILIPILVIASLARLHQGVVRQSMAVYYTFNGETFGYVLAITMIPALFFASKFDRIRGKLGTQYLMIGTLTAYTLLFLFGAYTQGPIPGIFYFVALMIGERIANQTTNVSANERLHSGHRATALSVLSLIAQLPYVILMFLFATWTEPTQIRQLILIFGIIAFVTFCYTLLLHLHKPKTVTQ